MQKFQLILKNEKLKQYRLFALLIVILNLAVFAVLAIIWPDIRYRSITLILFIILLFIAEHFLKKKGKAYNARAAATLLIIAVYIAFEMWWPAVATILLTLLYILSARRLFVYINSAHIDYPSLGKKVIKWNELSNIILKDGLLTIDFKNNKIIQQLVEDPAGDVNEKEFNEFCMEQLTKAN